MIEIKSEKLELANPAPVPEPVLEQKSEFNEQVKAPEPKSEVEVEVIQTHQKSVAVSSELKEEDAPMKVEEVPEQPREESVHEEVQIQQEESAELKTTNTPLADEIEQIKRRIEELKKQQN